MLRMISLIICVVRLIGAIIMTLSALGMVLFTITLIFTYITDDELKDSSNNM